MRILEHLKPEKVFYFFEEICGIPHGSGNTAEISRYLADFAKERNLECHQDEAGNVIIIKEATNGYENHEPVMLQGHMDMVAVKKPDYEIDMKKEGLRLCVDGDRIYAEGTSLGGDDGIAVAYGLALLDGTEYQHPRIELVITADEEVGMDGARAIDFAPCKARRLINLDSEEEGHFLAGCAGGARVNYELSYKQAKAEGIPCKIKVSGLLGGHSGGEIHKGRGNANCILGRCLSRLSEMAVFHIETLEGGLADNAIPREAAAEILLTGYWSEGSLHRMGEQGFLEESCRAAAEKVVADIKRDVRIELAEKDADVTVEVSFLEKEERSCMEEETSLRLIAFLNVLPHGVQAMSGAMEGLVETSLNIGILKCREGHFHTGISVRSSIGSAKHALIGKLKDLACLAGVEVKVTGDYPGWAFRKDSPLRDKMTEVYEEMFHKKPEIQAIHAGLECGLFADKIENLDCVSIGPDMKNIHTTEEELSISSAEHVWRFLVKLLEEL